jgi:2-dehydro-3-deoxygluconokinase
MKKVIGFGEIMMRLSPPGRTRFSQAINLDVVYGGAESNVISALAQWKIPSELITRLPENELGEACLQNLRRYGVKTDHILLCNDRIGIYFYENGSVIRGSKVIYDRENSAFSSIQAGMIDWDDIFLDAGWFHWTGITPAVSQGAYETLLEGLNAAKKHNLIISCDLNYRTKLWKWGRTAQEVIPELVELSNIVICNEEDMDKIFDIKASGVDVNKGDVDPEKYLHVCQILIDRFPNISKVAITLRGSLSASHNTWTAVLWSGMEFRIGSKYDLEAIEDRVGGGDSFGAGLIFGLITWPGEDEKALNYAIAASALKHTIFGDFNQVSRAEIENLMIGNASGRISR